MSDFLPKDYKVPSKADGYMKWQQGDNRFRIMRAPIIGWEWWVDEDDKRRPVRVHTLEEVPAKFRPHSPGWDTDAKHFWAMVVWNYEAKQFQVLEITQKGILKTIDSLSRDEDWGSPLNYDIVVTKTGEKLETEYELKPKPAKELDPEVAAKYKLVSINLDALYDGADPFSFTQSEKLSDDEVGKHFDRSTPEQAVAESKKEDNLEDLPF